LARIDKFLQAMSQNRAERLILASGERVVFIVARKPRMAGPQVVTTVQIQALLDEIAPADLSEAIGREGEQEFPYAAPQGNVQVRVVRSGATLRLEAVSAVDGVSDATDGPEDAAAAAPANATIAINSAAILAASRAVALDATTPSIDALFQRMVKEECSDLHLSSGHPPMFRKHGDIIKIEEIKPLAAEQVCAMIMPIVPEGRMAEFKEKHDTDFSYEIEGVARFRCNVFLDHKGMGGVFRVIPSKIATVEELGLSKQVLELCDLHKGLVLVTGPTGSGKSTTLAAMIDHINRTRPVHIITIEDPIEFVHPPRKALINQREVGSHTLGFKSALRAALREDPDIVLVGEMRDLETTAIAIETAETGHLVFGTLHTNTAPSTIDRAIDQFPADRQNQVRTMLSECLKGVIAQTLCKKKQGGRIAVLEILLVNSAVSNLIREGKTFQIPSIMQTGKAIGMVTLGDALYDLVRRNVIDAEEAYFNAVNKLELKGLFERAGIKLKAA
jgi:twitching motility protein PilT